MTLVLMLVTMLTLAFVLVALMVMVVREERLRGVDRGTSGGEDSLLGSVVEDVTLGSELRVAVPLRGIQEE